MNSGNDLQSYSLVVFTTFVIIRSRERVVGDARRIDF